MESERDQVPKTKVRTHIIVAFSFFVLLSAWFVIASLHAFAANADGGTVVLEGSSLVHGDPLLHGWSLSLDSFWTVDVLFYGLGVAILGVAPIAMHLIPALLGSLCVVVGLSLVLFDRRPREKIVACWIVLVGLCLPGHAMAMFLLQGPWHVATTLYCLIAIGQLRQNRFGWRWWIAVVLLALGLCGDFQMLALGVVPIALAGVLAMIRCRNLRSGWVTLSAAIAGSVVGIVLRVITEALGTFSVTESHHTVKAAQLARDVGHFVNWFGAIMGLHVGSFGGPSIPLVFALLHAVVVLLSGLGIIGALFSLGRGLVRGSGTSVRGGSTSELWRIDDLLLCCVAGAVGLFGLLTLSNNTTYARYLDPVVIFSVILAARIVPRWFDVKSKVSLRLGTLVMAIVVAGSTVTAVQAATRVAPTAPTSSLEAFLEHHHLTVGIGDYWAASIVTVDTHQQVVIRPVVANLRGVIVPDGRQASIDWYKHVHFSFLVYEKKPYGRVNPATVLHSFGTPAHVYVVGKYHVLTWKHPLVLTSPPFP